MSVRLPLLAFSAAAWLAACCTPTPIPPPPVPAVDGGYLTFSPEGLWLTAGPGDSAAGVISIGNAGLQDAQVTSVTVAGATRPVFSVAPANLDVAAGDAGVVTVTYAPPTCLLDGGQDRASLEVESDAVNTPTFSVTLVGSCASPDAGVPAPPDGGVDGGAA